MCQLIFLLPAAGAWAEDQFAPSAELPSLPGPNEADRPYYLTAKNVALFHDALIAPLATWLKEGRFVTRGMRTLDQTWDVSADWMQRSKDNASRVALTKNGTLALPSSQFPQGQRFITALPFGSAEEINKEPDTERRGAKILWNSLYAQFPVADLYYIADFARLSSQGVARRTHGVIYRKFFHGPGIDPSTGAEAVTEAHAVGPKGSTTPQSQKPPEFGGPGDKMLQEMIQLVSPAVVFGLSSVTWRYRGTEEDDVWIYSPVVERARKVFGSNRGDPLFEGFFTTDDLFVFSSKIQEVKARVADEKTLLVPFAYPSVARLYRDTLQAGVAESELALRSKPAAQMPEDPASQAVGSALIARGGLKRRNGGSAFVLWNYESSTYPAVAGWVPSTAVFVPRRVWIVEILPLDPFSLNGRQILIVDQETMLPVYKIVYDVRGVYSRTILGGWALAARDDRQVRFPFLAFLLSVERSSSHAAIMGTELVRTFEGRVSPASSPVRALLDISNHGLKQEPVEEKGEPAEEGGDHEAKADEAKEPEKEGAKKEKAAPAPKKTPPQEEEPPPDE